MNRSTMFCALAVFMLMQVSARAGITSHLTHYGAWRDADITSFRRFGLVALQPGMYEPAAQEAEAIARLRANGTKVLLYLSIGEDASTFDQAAPARGDGRGPVHWDASAGRIVYGNRGIASYYLDEWNAKGYDPDSVNKVPDGLPDRQGDWGSCLVNAGDSAWQALTLSAASALMALGADGLFLDTPETANPWSGYGWTAPGMHDLIRRLREAHPGKYLLLNRGLFFFDPEFAWQYKWSPRRYLDGVLFESYVTGSNYPVDMGGNGQWRENPYFSGNKHVSAPRLNAEMNRPDSRGTVFHIDYVDKPLSVAVDLPAVYARIRDEALVEQGWVPQINDRLLSQAPTLFIDNPPPPDRRPPAWRNTVLGPTAEGQAPPPRIGALKAIPGNGQVTLRWEVASDQTWPVRYNVYYTLNAPLDFQTAQKRVDVQTEVGADYADRAGTGAEDGCPYEVTVKGLQNNALYRFAVRAEDGTTGASPLSGRIGPGGGLEETNTQILMSIPRDSTAFPIVIDGEFADWSKVTPLPDTMGSTGAIDFTAFAATDDRGFLYVMVNTVAAADPSKWVLLFNADRRSVTGDITPAGSGYRGADYKLEGNTLYRHENWDWVRTSASIVAKATGTRYEVRLAKADLGLSSATGVDMLLASSDGREIMPKTGLNGFAYTFTASAPTALRPLPQPVAQARLHVHREGDRLRLDFPNPQRSAALAIGDLSGRRIHWVENVSEAHYECRCAVGPRSTLVVRVSAKGEPTRVRLWGQVGP